MFLFFGKDNVDFYFFKVDKFSYILSESLPSYNWYTCTQIQ